MDFLMIVKAVLSLLFVIGLLLVTVWGMKYIQQNMHKNGLFKKIKHNPRIDVLETRRIDAKNSLVLIKRDEAEHLLLVSHSQSLLIESNIKKGKK